MGKTPALRLLASIPQKHPHAHGEDFCVTTLAQSHSETPPRAWGRLIFSACVIFVSGNTPTRMGKTGRYISEWEYPWKHPHAHGEDPSNRKTRSYR